jgi:hypothetical protein
LHETVAAVNLSFDRASANALALATVVEIEE